MKTISIIGGTGMLGADVNLQIPANAYKVCSYSSAQCNLKNSSDIEKLVANSDIIINCAAYTNVDKAESEKDICKQINASSVGILGDTVARHNKYLIHISTDFVFGNSDNTALDEESDTFPLNYYGESKLLGERFLRDSGCKYSIIRVQWTYGENGINFISKIIELANRFKELKIVNDQVGSPTWTRDIAKAILCFIKKRPEGTFHFASQGYVNRYETARFVFNELGIDRIVNPCSSSEFRSPAARPLNSRFDCSKIDKILEVKRPSWQESLSEFLQKVKSNNDLI